MSLIDDLREVFSKSPPQSESYSSKDDFLLELGDRDWWTIQNSFEGTAIFGATGSGKTSGSGKHIALALLKAKFGGLVLTVKTDECKDWQKYAMEAGVPPPIVFGPVLSKDLPYSFNFLEYERRQNAKAPGGISFTDNLVALFSSVIEVASRSSGQGNQDAYWKSTLKQLMRNAIDLLLYAEKELTFREIYDIVVSAPSTPMRHGSPDYREWQENTSCGRCIAIIEEKFQNDQTLSDLELSHNYWTEEFPRLAPETRSIIVSYFTSMADPFLRGNLRDLFSSPADTPNQLDPKLTFEDGRIIILNLPVKTYNEMGQFAQALYKFIWQRAVERRDPKTPGQRPVFLWIDEAQFFVNSNDMLFMTTARSKQVATVYLTQSISNFYAIMPGDKGRAETDALLGNFNTKIFHANGDAVTNLWAADLIGKTVISRTNRTSSTSSGAIQSSSGSQFSLSETQEINYQVQPVAFTTFRKGGPENDFQVTGIIFQAGKVWSNGKNYLEIKFTQTSS